MVLREHELSARTAMPPGAPALLAGRLYLRAAGMAVMRGRKGAAAS